jgi:hypothetical protein
MHMTLLCTAYVVVHCVFASSLHTAIQRMTTGLHDHGCVVQPHTVPMVVITVGSAGCTSSFNTMNGKGVVVAWCCVWEEVCRVIMNEGHTCINREPPHVHTFATTVRKNSPSPHRFCIHLTLLCTAYVVVHCVFASSLHTAIQRMTTGLHDHGCIWRNRIRFQWSSSPSDLQHVRHRLIR